MLLHIRSCLPPVSTLQFHFQSRLGYTSLNANSQQEMYNMNYSDVNTQKKVHIKAADHLCFNKT